VPFFISLDRNEVRNRAGSGLIFIFKTFPFLNFKKICFDSKDPSELQSKESWNSYHPEDFPSAIHQHSPSMG
jgi:hypothetical protein